MRKFLVHVLSAAIGISIMFVGLDVAWRVWSMLRPASAWMTIERIYVANSFTTGSPILQVNRTIHAPFRGYWIVEVEKKTHGGFYPVCSASGKNLYEPNEILPENLNLDWWTWPVKCRPSPGTFRIVTNWQIVSDNYPDKQLSFVSNEFEIIAP